MEKNISIKDISKTGTETKAVPVKEKKAKELTPSEKFLLECDHEEKEIFNELMGVLTNPEQGDKYEFEAIKDNDESFEMFSMIITYIKEGILTIEPDGVVVKLRRPAVNDEGLVLSDTLKILYKKNKAREDMFKRNISLKKVTNESADENMVAVLAASFDNVDGKIISKTTVRKIQDKSDKDYSLLITVLNFFRF